MATIARRKAAKRSEGADWLVVLTLVTTGLFASLAFIPSTARAATLYVGGAGAGNYTTIQSAIDAASPGDMIYVYSQTYYENLLVNKTVSLVGENRETTVIDGGTNAFVIQVTSDWVNITGFKIANGWFYLDSVRHAIISNNLFRDNPGGVWIARSMDSVISDNTIDSVNQGGIVASDSVNITLANNTMIRSDIDMSGNLLQYWNTHTIDTSNTVNGRPVYYWKNVVGGTVPTGAGQVILANTTNVVVRDQSMENLYVGVLTGFSAGNEITANRFVDNTYSILLQHSSNNSIDNNTLADNRLVSGGGAGIYLVDSENNTVVDNTVSAGHVGIQLKKSRGTTIANNSVHTLWESILLHSSDGSAVFRNDVSSKEDTGISAWHSSNITVVENTAANGSRGITLYGRSNGSAIRNNTVSDLESWGIYITTYADDNTVFGNIVTNASIGIYVQWSQDNSVLNNRISTSLYGGIYVEASNNTFADNVVLDSGTGINLYSTFPHPVENNTIVGNTLSHNGGGIVSLMQGAEIANNTIAANLISSNNCGICLNRSVNNTFYHNNLINNTNQAFDDRSNFWDDGYPSGGNYWSDYAGVDDYSGPNQDQPGRDGIGDTPYNISGGSDRDRYPLIDPYRLPSQPLNLKATAEEAQVELNWTAPASDGGLPIEGYVIYRGNVSNNVTLLAMVMGVLNYTDTDLVGGRPYFYKVSAKNSAGEGPASDVVCAIPPTRPGPPINLTAVAGDRQINLNWSPPANPGNPPITNYEVFRGNASGGESFLIEVGDTHGFTDVGLLNGQQYYYRVSAKNAVGEGPTSNEISATPSTVPGPPSGFAAAASDKAVTLTWRPPSSDGGDRIVSYRLYRGTVPNGETFLAETVPVFTYFDFSLTNGQRYYYRISAKNAPGEGVLSNEVSARPAAAPGLPIGLVALAGDRMVELAWQPPLDDGGSPITNYTIYRGVIPGGEVYLVAVGSSLRYTDAGLTNGQSYYYRVSARNDIWEGSKSAMVSASPTAPPTVPSEPQNLRAAAGNGKITLSWSAPAFDGGFPVIGYMIYRGFPSGEAANIASIGDALTYEDSGLTNGVIYYYEVAAVNGVGEGEKSSGAIGMLLAPAPPVAHAAVRNRTLVGEVVVLDGSGSTGNITDYVWTISDEQGMEMDVLTGETVNYTFAELGFYTVTLNVTDVSTGLSSTHSIEVEAVEKTIMTTSIDVYLLLLTVLVLVSAMIAGGTEAGRVTLHTLLVALVFRKKVEGDSEIRGMVRGYIVGNPGDTYTHIKHNLDLNSGSLTWHLMKLEKDGFIVSKVDGIRKRYYPVKLSVPPENGGEIHDIQKRLLEAVSSNPGKRVGILAVNLGVSRQLALYHLRELSRSKLVSLERQGLHLTAHPCSDENV